MPRVKKSHKHTKPTSPIDRRKTKTTSACDLSDVLVVHLSVAEEMAAHSKYTGPQPLGPLALPAYMSHTIVDKSPKLPLVITDGELYATVRGALKKIRLIAFDEEGEKWKKVAERFQNGNKRRMVNVGAKDTVKMNDGPVVSDISPQELQTIQEALRHYRKKDEKSSKSTQTDLDSPPAPKSPKLIEFANRLKSLADTLYKATEVLPAPALEDLEELFDVDWMVEDMDKMVVGVISFQNGTDEKKRWRSGGKNEKHLFCQDDYQDELDTVATVQEPRSARISKSTRTVKANQALTPINAPQPTEPVTTFKILTKKRISTMPAPEPTLDPPPKSHKQVDVSRRMMCYICRYDKHTGAYPDLRISLTTKLCKECGDMPLCESCFPSFHDTCNY